MTKKNLFIGKQQVNVNNESVEGKYVDINGESYYKIENYDLMTPFFMSIVSSSDHWMFVSSNGGITAGRKSPDSSFFPYYTDDIIHVSNEITGSKTLIHSNYNKKSYLWEPFSNYYKNIYQIRRNLYKNIYGTKIIFEEENLDLGLKFSYSWNTSEKFGFVKKSELINNQRKTVKVNILDGIQNIIPYGVEQLFQSQLSTLADGYKKNELVQKYGIGIFSLSSIPSDKAEPSESLKMTTVWSTGIKVKNYLLSSNQLNNYRAGKQIVNEIDLKGIRGSYFINGNLEIKQNSKKDWMIIGDINQDLNSIAKIKKLFDDKSDISELVNSDIEIGTSKLINIVASADGLQLGNDKLGTSRHFSNTLFNVMRGGIFENGYIIETKDFLKFLREANKSIFTKHKNFIESLGKQISYDNLKVSIKTLNDPVLIKLSLEYLPLTFSRRHGDPSRPWNKFSIDLKNEKNEKVLNYQGNWRDLFQNWEALALSYPNYLESMITKFLNATTADGYNPYRVSRDGFDWEAPEPENPWANIGYWGDHQIIYLLKLLELAENLNPLIIKSRLHENIYAYANVPYRIKKYDDLLRDPQNTIDFIHELHDEIIAEELKKGSDARYLKNAKGSLVQVNLAEKLLVTLLAKLSNFIPGAGIWLNTQRPEWNDANNALVGYGVSMVTLYYMRRYVAFCLELFSDLDINSILFSKEVSVFFNEIHSTLSSYRNLLKKGISDQNRKNILDGLGNAGEKYREKIYNNGFSSEKENIELSSLTDFFLTVEDYIDNSIKMNRRDDGLYHSYNLISISEKTIAVSHLYEMLEGQVAVLSSGLLSPSESIELLKTLRSSRLYRKDQNSYLLYPDRELPLFVEKNIIPKKLFKTSQLFKELDKQKNTEIICKDVNNQYHFNGEFRNSKLLKLKLEMLEEPHLKELVKKEKSKVLEIYEQIFNHKSFTGRSGTFYKYEGLGSIYWHMVSKLALAVNEMCTVARINNADIKEVETLKKYYYKIKEGIGLYKSPELYGAFPTDPYSHTPSFSGVQQPGMTGQVKEDIISRFGELGIKIKNGHITIDPFLFNNSELLKSESTFDYFDVSGEYRKIFLPKDSLVFTFCQVPFIYLKSDENKLLIRKKDKQTMDIEGLKLNENLSRSIINRNGEIAQVEVFINFK